MILNSCLIKTFLLAFFCLHSTDAYKILMVCPQLVSHILEQVSMGSVLLKAGHQVHLVLETNFDPDLIKRFQSEGFQIEFFRESEDFISLSSEGYRKILGNQIFNESMTLLSQVPLLSKPVNTECESLMLDDRFLQNLKLIGFDLIVVEPFIMHMCLIILPKYLEVPFVTLTNTYIAFNIRSPALPSFYPRQFIDSDVHKHMSFSVRFLQLLVSIFFSSRMSPFNKNVTLLHKYAPGIEYWEDLLRESLLFFYEIDHHFNNFLPTLPNHISVSGMTCFPAKPLPENIVKFISGRIINGNDPGVVLMTFGSTASYLPRSTLTKFLKTFSLLNETVIAKLKIEINDEELISLIPPNVLVLNWLPQNDILGHPSTKLFITHCGNNGQHEALYHGVPMLGFPLFADQGGNSRRLKAKGFGLTMDIHSFTESELLENMLEIMYNPKYKNSIQHMSNVFKDQPLSAHQKVAFWVEHVIKYGGDHLRSNAMDLPLYQFLCFDTIAVLILIIITSFYLLIKVLKYCLKKILSYYYNKVNFNVVKKRS